MAQTTFSGPIKAGTISNTTGIVLGTNIKNTGQVVMSQSVMIDAAVAAGTTTYNVGVIPKNSQLLTVILRCAVVSNAGTSATVSVGKTGTAAFLVAATNVKALGESFRWFFETYNHTWEQVQKATSMYVNEYRDAEYMYMQTSQYFISKQDKHRVKHSTLADYCDMIRDGIDTEEQTFKEKVV